MINEEKNNIEDKKDFSFREKGRLIFHGVALPFLLFIIVTFLTSCIYVIITHNNNPNIILVQGIADIYCSIGFFILYSIFKKKNQIYAEKFKLSNCLMPIAIAVGVCISGNILVYFIPAETENLVSKEIYNISEQYSTTISLLIVAIFIPIVEELLFRGFFYDTIKIISNNIVAIILSSLIFAIAHWDLRQCLYAFFAGLFLGYIKYKYNNVAYTIIMHLVMNAISLIAISFILTTDDVKYKIFMLFISFALILFSLYRINMNKNRV